MTAQILAQASDGFEINYFVVAIPSMIFGGLIGALIGNAKNRMGTGLILGALLGCLGWIIMAILPRKD